MRKQFFLFALLCSMCMTNATELQSGFKYRIEKEPLALKAKMPTIPAKSIAAENDATSGKCGDNLNWSFNSSTRTLTITGSGAMYNYYMYAPWYSYVSEIETINLPTELTSIGNYAFFECSGLTSITIPNSVTSNCLAVFNWMDGLFRGKMAHWT